MGRSGSMTKRVLTTLGTLLSDAQERGLVIRNAAREMQVRRGNGANRQEKRQKGRLKVGVDIPNARGNESTGRSSQGPLPSPSFDGYLLRITSLGAAWSELN